ncbi:hypothetical protein [Halalkalibacter urbisdiaboli]|nr:hypothetical protein [Halalkalibacter urbisdiaboli]
MILIEGGLGWIIEEVIRQRREVLAFKSLDLKGLIEEMDGREVGVWRKL